MRTNIDIDETSMAEAMTATGASTKREAVKRALTQVVRVGKQLKVIEHLRGIG